MRGTINSLLICYIIYSVIAGAVSGRNMGARKRFAQIARGAPQRGNQIGAFEKVEAISDVAERESTGYEWFESARRDPSRIDQGLAERDSGTDATAAHS